MTKRLPLSEESLTIHDASIYHQDATDALRLFFSEASPLYALRFVGDRPEEVRVALGERLAELDRTTTMSLLAAVEAAFRVDYLQRCYRKTKDAVSRQFLELYKEKQTRVSLEDDIFEIWKANTSGSAQLIGDLRGAFRFRHWMAHGRYWNPKLGRKYDYLSVYSLAIRALDSFPLMLR